MQIICISFQTDTKTVQHLNTSSNMANSDTQHITERSKTDLAICTVLRPSYLLLYEVQVCVLKLIFFELVKKIVRLDHVVKHGDRSVFVLQQTVRAVHDSQQTCALDA